MSWFYLDAAGLMKKYRTEPGTVFVLELFAHKDDRETFITSYVATIESNRVIARLRNAQVLSEAAANILLGDIARDMNDSIRVLPVSPPVLVPTCIKQRTYVYSAHGQSSTIHSAER